jgi:hypothetical protein
LIVYDVVCIHGCYNMISLPPEFCDFLASLGLLLDMFVGKNAVELMVCFGRYVLIYSAAYYQ